MSHTPGPWTLEADPDYRVNGREVMNRVASEHKWICKVMGLPERDANARLVVAAPELLEALQAIQRGFADGSIQFTKKRQSDTDPYHRANTLMCAALAKVEGR